MSEPTAMQTQEQKRVFVMDDSAFALELARTALAEAGIIAVCGRDLQDLAKLPGARADLILMDVEMPEAFGDDVASMLGGETSVPVYLLSSLPGEELERRARECGAAGYIEKQLGIAGVVAYVRSILGVEGTATIEVPPRLIAELVSTANGRIRRAEGAFARSDPSAAGMELHTLAGEAALLGLLDVARAASAGRAVTGEGREAFDAALVTLRRELEDAAQVANVPRPAAVTAQGRVLLLDDSELYRSVMMAMLEDAGFEVVEARRLSEARHRMRAGKYDVAVLDMQLEDGHGHELIGELRQHVPGVRIVLLSADAQDAAARGADLALSKLQEPGDIVKAIGGLARP
jgi:DNA-binding response OmpR family regulator